MFQDMTHSKGAILKLQMFEATIIILKVRIITRLAHARELIPKDSGVYGRS